MNKYIVILYFWVALLTVSVFVSTRNLEQESLTRHMPQPTALNKRAGGQISGVPQQCPPQQFMTGLADNGTIRCAALPVGLARGSQVNKPDVGECYGHGFIEHGFCSCDEGWTGPECQYSKPPPDPNALPDNDHDNVPVPADCDDDDDLVYPGAPDSVDGKDNDCDGEIDEGF